MSLRKAPKGPLAVSAILAMPLFFTALMAVSLAVEKPTVTHVLRHGATVAKLGDPTGTTEVTIWLLAIVAPFSVVAVGTGAMLIGRAGVIVSALAAIGATIIFLVPLGTWTARHTARYPDGVDLIRQSSTSDVYLRGEWEGTARRTARQLGIVTIVLGGIAIGAYALLEVRRRRGVVPPVPPPPPEVVTGGNIAGQR
jgi:hypothetical protein